MHREFRANIAKIAGLLTGSTSVLAMMVAPAQAQSAAETSASQNGLAEIIVTARRVEESLQDVPLTINALNTQELSDQQITQIADLRGAVPNLTVNKTATAGGVVLNLRGQASGNLPNITYDSRVGAYLDGVYVARTQGGSFQLADIERLEVLKGPQGTQFGKNLTGGAVNFITASPGGEAKGIFESTLGNLGRKRIRLTLESPRVGGFAVRGTIVHDQQEGDRKNLSAGTDYGRIVYPPNDFNFDLRPAHKSFVGYNTEAYFLALRYENDGNLVVDLKGDYTDSLEYLEGNQTLGFAPTFVGCAGAALVLGLPANCGSLASWPLPLTSATANRYSLGFDSAKNRYEPLSAPSVVKSGGISLTISYQLSDALELKSITGYREVDTLSQLSLDGGEYYLINDNVNILTGGAAGLTPGELTPYCISCSFQSQSQEQISEELQLIGNIGSNLDFLGGFYYFKEEGESPNTYIANFNPIFAYFGSGLVGFEPDGVTQGSPSLFANGDDVRIDSRSTAVYGRATVRPLEKVEVTLGARYTWDEKRNIISPTLQALNIDPATGAPPPLDRTVKFDQFTYDIAATYHFTPDISVYGRWATAYLAGGLLRNIAFEPEKTKAAEIGIKSELFNRRLRLNAAAFWQKSTDLQVATSLPPFGALAILNVGELETKGFEVQAVAIVTGGLTLNANLGYTHEDYSDGSRNQSPEWSLRLGGNWQLLETATGAKFAVSASGSYLTEYGGGRYPLYSVQAGADPTIQLPSALWEGEFSRLRTHCGSQKMTVAAMQMSDMKVWAHRS